jgi:mannosyltransferase OCH1-like enzyme
MATFQTFWYGEVIPLYVKRCFETFTRSGHDYHLYSYRRYDDLPEGVTWKDAADILPESRVFFYRNPDGSQGSVAAFSDLFRYELLAKHGKWWVDADVACLGGAEPAGSVFFGWECDEYVCNAIMKFPEDHPVLLETLRRCREQSPDNLAWGATGPKLLTAVINKHGFTRYGYPAAFAYPVSWKDHEALVRAGQYVELKSRLRGVPMLHLWNERFKSTPNLDLNAPEVGSIVAEVLYNTV